MRKLKGRAIQRASVERESRKGEEKIRNARSPLVFEQRKGEEQERNASHLLLYSRPRVTRAPQAPVTQKRMPVATEVSSKRQS